MILATKWKPPICVVVCHENENMYNMYFISNNLVYICQDKPRIMWFFVCPWHGLGPLATSEVKLDVLIIICYEGYSTTCM